MNSINLKKCFSITILFVYLIIRFFFTHWLDSLGEYTTYYLESILAVVSVILYFNIFKTSWRINKSIFIFSLFALVSGFLIYKMAIVALQITIPFNLKSTETILFLLIIAPILEEMIFRFSIWQPLEYIHSWFAYLGTSLLFAYSHFHAYWFIPEEFHKFVFYQTAYTLLLGLICGYFIKKYSSLSEAILIHFSFNFGFYLCSQF